MKVGTASVIQSDARCLPLSDDTVDLIVTSPPYFALRSYQDGGEHFEQIGSEATPQDFVDALSACMVEWWRVLKPSGSVWVNLGDKYAGSGGHNNAALAPQGMHIKRGDHDDADSAAHKRSATRRNAPNRYNQNSDGIRAKSLMGLPWRFALEQIDAGWILRAEVIWDKPNGMPESVTDRVRRSHEQWFHFVKEPQYFSAMDELREPHSSLLATAARSNQMNKGSKSGVYGANLSSSDRARTDFFHPLGKLPSSVWHVASDPLIIPDDVQTELDLPDHFAAFPQEWPRRIILGWSPPDGIVLDPFGGTGTTAGVARMLGRYGISSDLSADYNRLAAWRIWHSGHFAKTEQRTWGDRQGSLSL